MPEHVVQVTLFVIGAANTIALFAVGVMVNAFRRTIDALKADDKDLGVRVGRLEVRSAKSEAFHDSVETMYSAINSRLDRMNGRFDKIDSKLDRLDRAANERHANA